MGRATVAGVRGALSRVALALVSAAVTVLLVDVALRIASIGAPRRGILKPRPGRHPLTGWIDVFPPGYAGILASGDFQVAVRAGSLGLREHDLDLEALSRQRPYLFLGDSFFFGWGVEQDQRLSERLEARLRQEGPSAPVVNFSFPGWGTYHYLEVWRHFVPRLNPRLVIVSAFVGNDFTDDLRQVEWKGTEAASDAQADDGGRLLPHLTGRELLATSPLVGLVNRALWKSPAFRSAFNRLEIRNDRIVLYEDAESDLQRRLYAATESGLSSLAQLSRDSGVPLLVVLIPDHLQVLTPELFVGYDFERPQRRLREHLAREGLPCLDLLPLFRALPTPAPFFFPHDKHWTPRGHTFVAEALLRTLRAREGPP